MWASGVKPVTSDFSGYESKLKVTLSENLTVTTDVWTAVPFNTVVYDALEELDAGNNRVEVLADGYYTIKYNIQVENVGDGNAAVVRLRVNGVDLVGTPAELGHLVTSYTQNYGAIDVQLSAGDLITIDVYHSKGSDRTLYATQAGGTTLCMHRFA